MANAIFVIFPMLCRVVFASSVFCFVLDMPISTPICLMLQSICLFGEEKFVACVYDALLHDVLFNNQQNSFSPVTSRTGIVAVACGHGGDTACPPLLSLFV